jgi:hypothetical protein
MLAFIGARKAFDMYEFPYIVPSPEDVIRQRRCTRRLLIVASIVALAIVVGVALALQHRAAATQRHTRPSAPPNRPSAAKRAVRPAAKARPPVHHAAAPISTHR